MKSLFDMILDEFKYRKCAHTDIYPAHFTCSLGAHVFNLVNQEIEIISQSSIPVDTRIHIMFVAPPGFCLDKWSIITMEDGSKKFLRDIKVGDKLASENGEENIVLNRWESCKGTMRRIQPHNMCVSKQHRIKTSVGWKYAKDIVNGDLLETVYTKDSLKLLAWWLTEGRFEGKWWTPIISTTDERVLDELHSSAKKFGLSWEFAGPAEYRFTHGKRSSERNKLAEFLRWFGYDRGRNTNSGNKYIPVELMNGLDPMGLVYIVSQLWRGDGTDKQQMRYASKSRRLLSQIIKVLKRHNIGYSLYDYEDLTAEIYIWESERQKLYDLFSESEKYTQFKGVMEVTGIEDVDYRRYAIDLETTQEHFIANGIVVHNSKTFWLEQYLRGGWSILEDTSIMHGFEGSTTEAGFVGSADMKDGEAFITPGLANIYKYGIVGFEEFSALAAMMKSQHSRQLDAALLLALDKGYVVKRLRAGKIGYKTNVTVWCGTQPSRFDLTSGLGRRFYYLMLIPNRKDRKTLDDAMWEGYNVRMDKNRTANIRSKIDELYDELMMVKKVEISAGLRPFLQKMKMEHYEYPLFIRLLIGYKVTTGDFDRTMVLDLDDRIKSMMIQEGVWRREIMRGPELTECVMVLQEHGDSMTIRKFCDEMMRFGVDYRRSMELLKEMAAMKIVVLGETQISLRATWKKGKK